MTENKSLLLYARLAARLEDFMPLRSLPSAILGIYTCIVLSLLFILCVLCAVKNKFTLPYLMGPCRSIFVLMDSNGSMWVLISPYASLWVLRSFLCPYSPLWILMGPSVSLWVLLRLHGSLCVLIGLYAPF